MVVRTRLNITLYVHCLPSCFWCRCSCQQYKCVHCCHRNATMGPLCIVNKPQNISYFCYQQKYLPITALVIRIANGICYAPYFIAICYAPYFIAICYAPYFIAICYVPYFIAICYAPYFIAICYVPYFIAICYAPYYTAICGLPLSTIFFHITSKNGAIFGKKLLNIKCV